MNSYIKSISYYLPEKVVTNDELRAENPSWDIDEIFDYTGVKNRHICAEDETPSDMAVKAANKLFTEHNIEKDKIDFIIFCTQNNDYKTPTTACILQNRLDLPEACGAVDINQGCTGYIYGLSLAKGLVESGSANNVLLLTSEAITKFIHPKDKSTMPLFGDGASASIISGSDSKKSGINSFVFGTNGKGYDSIILEYFGARNPIPEKEYEIIDNYGNIRMNTSFYMNGSKVFLFSIKTGPKLIREVLIKNKLNIEDIDMFIFHQASKFILETIAKKLNIPEDKYYLYLEECGNTVSSTIPIAFCNALKERKIEKGNKVMLISFGVGYSWGATIIDY